MSERDAALRSAFKGDFDAAAVPIKDAATILIFEDRPDLHVLMMRRRARSDFVGGMMVFPGGGLDDADRDESAFSHVSGHVAEEHKSYLLASIRETFEECGVLLTSTPPPEAAFRRREAIQREHMTLAQLLDEYSLTVDASAIHPIARWITPIGPPRRYDTVFFAAAMPPGQEATGDDDEAEHLEWVRPRDGMVRWEAGEYVMLPPTTAMLQLLARFTTTAEVIGALERADHELFPAVVIGNERGDYRVVLPGDDGYDPGQGRAENGWVRRLR